MGTYPWTRKHNLFYVSFRRHYGASEGIGPSQVFGGPPAPAPRPVEPRRFHCLSSGNGPAPALWTTGVFQKAWLLCPFFLFHFSRGKRSFRVSTVFLVIRNFALNHGIRPRLH